MTLTAAGLAAAITAQQGPAQDMTIQDDENLKLATALITYITANAVVNATVAVTSVSGVTTGAGVSGPGTGTASGTIS